MWGPRWLVPMIAQATKWEPPAATIASTVQWILFLGMGALCF
jgi:hypothetical protein